MANYDSNYAIAQEISARIGNSPVPFDSVYSICLAIYQELGGTEEDFDSVYSILLEILPLATETAHVIDDSVISSGKTWSSSKINSELGEKQNTLTAGQNISIDSANTISAEGYIFDSANGNFSVIYRQDEEDGGALLANTITGLYGSYAEGYQNTTSGGYGAHTEGNLTIASGDSSHAEGYSTTASVGAAHAEGNRSTASGRWGSHAEGYSTTASGQMGHSEGYGSIASGDYGSHAEGYYTTASGTASHAEGGYVKKSDNTLQYTVASGNYSHAEGAGTLASGAHGSHAEGELTIASGGASHAEGGNGTEASGDFSHAEGEGTSATNSNAHSEGAWSIANGNAAHAEGRVTEANGDASHAEGYYTVAQNRGEHAEGVYNVSHTGSTSVGKTIHSVGIGSDNARSNAQEVMLNADMYIYGIGGYDGVHIKGEVSGVTVQTVQDVVSGLETSVAGKQDTLTAGEGIEISGDTISCTVRPITDVNVLPNAGENKDKVLRLDDNKEVYISKCNPNNAPESGCIGNATCVEDANKEEGVYDGEQITFSYYTINQGTITVTGYKWIDLDDNSLCFATEKPASEIYYYEDENHNIHANTGIYLVSLDDLTSDEHTSFSSLYIPQLNVPDAQQIDNAYINTNVLDNEHCIYKGVETTIQYSGQTITGYTWVDEDKNLTCYSTKRAFEIYNTNKDSVDVQFYNNDGGIFETTFADGNLLSISTVKYQRNEYQWKEVATSDELDSKQDELVAGQNITISGTTISATYEVATTADIEALFA